MQASTQHTSPARILVVDDCQSIHDAIARLLRPPRTQQATSGAIVSAMAGPEALRLVESASAADDPVGMAFVDLHMGSGWDGLDTIERLWKVDPFLPVVICTGYGDLSWEQTNERLGALERLLILKKPFAPVEVRQMAAALCRQRTMTTNCRHVRAKLEASVRDGMDDLRGEIAKREQVEGSLRRARKLESVGELAAGLAHEVNTPLQFVGHNLDYVNQSMERLVALIKSYRDIDLELLPPAVRETVAALHADSEIDEILDDLPEALDETIDGVLHLTKIVGAMKTLAHPARDVVSAVNIPAILNHAILISSFEHKHVADVRLDLPELPLVNASSSELARMFVNLIVNAAHAIAECAPERGRGVISVSAESTADRVQVRVQDTGAGIPPDVRDRIFERFFTTKAEGVGTGQGLALCAEVVKNYGGDIDCVSSPHGTVFTVSLPTAPEPSPTCH